MFLSLCLPVIISLFLVLLEGARINAIRMQIELTAATAADSVLAEFHQELFKQYDLLMIDTSYGTSSAAVSNTESHLQTYFEKNFETAGTFSFGKRDFTGLSLTSLSVSDTRFAADNNCEALREQIYAYYAAEPLGEMAAEILAQIDTFNGLGLDTDAWSSRKTENETALREGLERAAQSDDSETDGEDTETGAAAAEAAEFVEGQGVSADAGWSLYSVINQLLSAPVLTQIYGGTSSLSQAGTDTAALLSNRSVHTGDGAEAENSHGYSEADTVVFDMYVFEKCGCFTDQRDKNELKYQIEYLLYGKASDTENLEKAAETLLLIRLAANLVTIMQDSGKQAQAQTWGSALSLLCLCPELESVFTTAILLAWTYMESLHDVKVLLNGGSVPLLKSSSEWSCGLTSIFTGEYSGTGGESGLDYETYLHILLFLENGNTKNYRLMDLMEMDIRAVEGNENFRMDWCMDTFTLKATVTSSYGYSYTISRETTYN